MEKKNEAHHPEREEVPVHDIKKEKFDLGEKKGRTAGGKTYFRWMEETSRFREGKKTCA